MLGAVIRNGNNTLVVELPTGTMDLQTKLSSIGITQTADRIPISDEDFHKNQAGKTGKEFAKTPNFSAVAFSRMKLSRKTVIISMQQKLPREPVQPIFDGSRISCCLLACLSASMARYFCRML